MPEGHTIHRITKYQRRFLVGQKLAVSSPQGRFEDGAGQVSGHTLKSIEPHGKHLFYHYDHGLTVHVHLGMHGRFRYTTFTEDPPPPRGQVRMRMITDRRVVDLNGPTACEVLQPAEVAAIHARLGPDLLDPAADREQAWQKIHRSRQMIGGLLMDQSVLSGIGNAYRSEVLYRQKLDPKTRGVDVTRAQFDAIWDDAAALLKLGVKQGIMVTVDPDERVKPDRAFKRRDRDRFYVYRRPACLRCGAVVLRYELNGRTVYVCPREQLGQKKAPQYVAPDPEAAPKRAKKRAAGAKPGAAVRSRRKNIKASR